MDIEYLLLLQNLRSSLGGIFDSFFSFITNIAVDYYAFIIPLIIFWTYNKRKGIISLLSLGVSDLLNAFTKIIFCIYRPWIRDSRIKPLEAALPGATGYSFPSGHATCAGAVYSSLIYNFKKHKGIVILSVLMIALTMFSRNYVGVHTPQDVFVGLLLGIISTLIAVAIANFVEKNKNGDIIVLIIGIVFAIAVIVFAQVKAYPIDYVDGKIIVDPEVLKVNSFKGPGEFLGILFAWFIERRFIKFDTSGTTYQKVLRCLVGVLLLVFLYTISTSVGKLININYMYTITNALTPIIMICIYPLTWKLFRK